MKIRQKITSLLIAASLGMSLTACAPQQSGIGKLEEREEGFSNGFTQTAATDDVGRPFSPVSGYDEQKFVGIFYFLYQHRGTIVSRDEIMDYLWSTERFIDDNTLTVNMNRLRRKLADIGLNEVIETRRGQGYLLK